MKKGLAISLWLVTVLIVAGGLSMATLFIITRPADRVVATWPQSSKIKYDEATYYLSVIETDQDWRGFPLFSTPRYAIYVGRDQGAPSYGHIIDFTFYTKGDYLPSYLKKAQVDWSNEGVNLSLPSGHKLFIPRHMFVGGR